MALSLVGATGYSNGGSTSTGVTMAKPTGLAAGDLMLAFVAYRDRPVIAVPSGWALLRDTADSGGLALYTKTATASEPASYTWTTRSDIGAGYSSGGLVAYRDVLMLGASAAAGGTATAGAFAAPSVTTAANDGETLVCGWYIDRNSAGYTSVTPPADMTERVDPAGYVVGLSVADLTPVNGATGTKTATLNTASTAAAGAISVLLVGNTAPDAPVLTTPAQDSAIDRAVVNRLGWDFSDPNPGDSQSQFDLQWWDLDSSNARIGVAHTVTQSVPNTFWDAPAGTFTVGRKEWQVRTYDSLGVVGPYSTSSFFTAGDLPASPVFTDPINGQTIPAVSYVATISAPDVDATQWRKVADNAGAPDPSTVYFDSGVLEGTPRTYAYSFPVNDRYEHLQARVRYGGLWSSWTSVRILVSFTPSPVPIGVTTPVPADAAIDLAITNPAPGAGEPAVAYNNVWFAEPGEAEKRRATLVPPNSTWRHWDPTSDVAYTYRIEAVATTGATAEGTAS